MLQTDQELADSIKDLFAALEHEISHAEKRGMKVVITEIERPDFKLGITIIRSISITKQM